MQDSALCDIPWFDVLQDYADFFDSAVLITSRRAGSIIKIDASEARSEQQFVSSVRVATMHTQGLVSTNASIIG